MSACRVRGRTGVGKQGLVDYPAWLHLFLHHPFFNIHLYSVQTISVMWVRPRVLPAPGDLLRRDDPGLFAVLLGVAERLWLDFTTLHSGETEHRVGVRVACINLPPSANLSE